MHKTCRIQLSHTRIYNGIACHTIAPTLKILQVFAPWNLIVLWLTGFVYYMRSSCQDHGIEVSPNELVQKSAVKLVSLVGQGPYADCTKTQVYAQARGSILGWEVSVLVFLATGDFSGFDAETVTQYI